MNEIECRLLYWNGEPTNYVVTAYGDIYNIITWHKLTPCEDSSGRLRVCLTINGKCITTTVHKIVYIAFYGDYDNSLTINHIDEDFQNGRLTPIRNEIIAIIAERNALFVAEIKKVKSLKKAKIG